MQTKHTSNLKFLILIISASFCVPSLVSAAFVPGVPVDDAVVQQMTTSISQEASTMRMMFDRYLTLYETRTLKDSEAIKELLSLNPTGRDVAELVLEGNTKYANGGKTLTEEDEKNTTKCVTRFITNPNGAVPRKDGAWEELEKIGYLNKRETDFSDVRVNDSTSLTCLLQELVEFNKLQANMQIHALLRDYINNALAVSLAQRQASLVSKANLDWINKGNVITVYDDNGLPISEESYSDPEEYKRALLRARTRTLQNQILDSNKENNICGSFNKYDIVRNMLKNAEVEDADLIDNFDEEIGCQITNKIDPRKGLFASDDDLNSYYDDATVGNQNPFKTYMALLSKKSNTKQGLELLMETKIGQQKNQIAKNTETDYVAGGGYLPTRQCDPMIDKNCDIRNTPILTSGRLIGDITKDSVMQQYNYLNNVQTADQLSAAASDNYSSVNVLAGGLKNYDTRDLYPSQNISREISQFLSGIRDGYFDLQSGTIDWASGAMLQIYDNTMLNSQAYTGADTLNGPPRDSSTEI